MGKFKSKDNRVPSCLRQDNSEVHGMLQQSALTAKDGDRNKICKGDITVTGNLLKMYLCISVTVRHSTRCGSQLGV